jgi:hypothetical protein
MKKKSGNGGTMLPKPVVTPTASEAAIATSLAKKSKMSSYSAFCARANPPNTELRR